MTRTQLVSKMLGLGCVYQGVEVTCIVVLVVVVQCVVCGDSDAGTRVLLSRPPQHHGGNDDHVSGGGGGQQIVSTSSTITTVPVLPVEGDQLSGPDQFGIDCAAICHEVMC